METLRVLADRGGQNGVDVARFINSGGIAPHVALQS
jgi:hypothetical protein